MADVGSRTHTEHDPRVRSTSILSINVEAETSDPDDGHSVVTHGKMLFVDLADSERLKESKSEGLAAVETGSINKSLFILVSPTPLPPPLPAASRVVVVS